ncbi:MFS transporter [Caldiplasma sukawensis]
MNFRSNNIYILILGSGIFISTFDIAAISVGIKPISEQFSLGTYQITLIAASSIMGAAIGSFPSGLFSDRFGRKSLITVDIIGYFIFETFAALSFNFETLFISRLFVGFAIGMDFSVAFPYIKELSEESSSKGNMAVILFAANFGMIVAYGLGTLLNTYFEIDGWRYILLSGSVISLPFIFLRGFLPESKKWKNESRKSMKNIMEDFFSNKKIRIAFYSYSWFSYQVSDQGFSVFLPAFFAVILFVSNPVSDYFSLITKMVTIPAALVTVWLIKKIAILRLQEIGFLGRAIPLLILGSIGYINTNINYILIFSLLFTSFFFGAMGPDKTTVIAPADAYETRHSASGEGFSQMIGRLGGITGIFGFGILSGLYGVYSGLIFFGIFSFSGFIATSLYSKYYEFPFIKEKPSGVI